MFPTDILDSFALGQPFSLEADFLAKAAGMQRIDLFVTSWI